MDEWTPLTTDEYIKKVMEQERETFLTTHKKSANSKQVAGSHYSDKEIQPWDYIHANNLCYFTGNCVKYVSRWRDKGGINDLKKAIHYLEKLIELEEGK